MAMDGERLAQDGEGTPSRQELERSLHEARSQLKETLDWLRELEGTLDDIKGSVSWKLARQLESAGLYLAPPGSRRSRAMFLCYRAVMAVPRLRNRHYVAHKLKTALSRARGTANLVLRPFRVLAERATAPLRSPVRPGSLPLHFPAFEHIDVSIIIPVFNHCRETAACLESIARLTSGPSYEVIVVDDGSTDETAEMLGEIEGLVALRNDQNLGFIGSCNRGAEAARGPSSPS